MKYNKILAMLRKPIMPVFRWIVRRKIFIPILAYYYSKKIKIVESDNVKNENSITILALNSERYMNDLTRLSIDSRVKIITLPSEIQGLITAPFLASLRKIMNGQPWYVNASKPEVVKTLDSLTEYLISFLPVLQKLVKFDVLISCTFYYWQDRAWEKASPLADIPYIALHKENMKDDVIIDMTIERYRQRGYKFNGSKIAVYNNKEKLCLVESGVASSDMVSVVGAPRMDDLFKSINEELPPLGNDVTLFSFRHAIGGLILDDNVSGFSRHRSCGFIEYFDLVHGQFALAAINNPDRIFHIKPKWSSGIWDEQIADSVFRYTGKKVDEISNLKVCTEIDAQSLIKRSAVVVGVNSTALIESKIFGRPTIIPFFAEAANKHVEHIFYQKYFDLDFIMVRDAEDLSSVIEKELASSNLSPSPSSLVEDFLGYTDGNSKDRVINMFESEIKL